MNIAASALAAVAFLCWGQLVHAADMSVMVQDHRGRPIADAVVLAVPGEPRNAVRPKPPLDAVDQVDKQFVPFVKPIFVGSKVRFPNSDKIRHQVYSFSPSRKFELPLYGGDSEAPPIIFDKPGVVVLGCNIHDWMVGYIYVAETPYFAKSQASGKAAIEGLPPGEYRVRVWHPRMEQHDEGSTRIVTVAADPPTHIVWEMGLKPTFRVPRMTGGSSASYP